MPKNFVMIPLDDSEEDTTPMAVKRGGPTAYHQKVENIRAGQRMSAEAVPIQVCYKLHEIPAAPLLVAAEFATIVALVKAMGPSAFTDPAKFLISAGVMIGVAILLMGSCAYAQSAMPTATKRVAASQWSDHQGNMDNCADAFTENPLKVTPMKTL